MRDQVQLEFALQNHLLQQFVFADVSPDVFDDLARGQQQAVAQSVHADVVADCLEVFRALTDQCANQVFGDSAQSESANHESGAIGDVFDGFVGVGNDFIHRKEF